MTVRYGKIESTEVVAAKTKSELYGGLRGIKATSDLPPVPREKIEANVKQIIAPEAMNYLYVIKFADGKSIRVKTDKAFFDRRDCVAVEQGELVNLRLVADDLCNSEIHEQRQKQFADVQAKQCAIAKRQLILAQTDRQVDDAGEQIRRLCQFSRTGPF
ncbi:MAG: hypothetical protein ACI82A_001782 [Candidatus Azotimanducaceae bacterium]|jgi:hypothetical protein